MSLSPQQRYGSFFIGVGIGTVMVMIYFSVRGLPHPPEPPAPGVIRREVPGVFAPMMQLGQPLTGDFILSQMDDRAGTHTDGLFHRWLVVPGLDQGAYIRIEETARLAEPDRILDWKFMFADRVHVKLTPNADTRAFAEAMKPLGWSFLGGKDKDGWVEISLGAHRATSLPEALLKLAIWPQWIAQAEPDYLTQPAAAAEPGHS